MDREVVLWKQGFQDRLVWHLLYMAETGLSAFILPIPLLRGLCELHEEHHGFLGIKKERNTTAGRPSPIQSIGNTAPCSALVVTSPLLKTGLFFQLHGWVIKLDANMLKMLQETCSATERKEKSTETHRIWKQKTTGKPLSSKNKRCPLQSRTHWTRQGALGRPTKHWKTSITPYFLWKMKKRKKKVDVKVYLMALCAPKILMGRNPPV